MVDARANAPEKQQEVLALVIDRETSNEVSRINKEIGQSVYWHPAVHRRHRVTDKVRLWDEFDTSNEVGQKTVLLGKDASYQNLIIEYTQLKLLLHDLRKSCYYRGDPYSEREDIDVQAIMDRCDDLRKLIKEQRRVICYAAWGGMEPNKATVYDKPLLYAFDEYTCSHITNKTLVLSEEDVKESCPLKGEHWYHAKPYCRAHLGEARRQFKMDARAKRHRWACNAEPKCDRTTPHWHNFGGTHYALGREL